MDKLVVYETFNGRYAVRPESWTGIWKDGKLLDGLNHKGIFDEKEDAEWYAETKNAEEQGLLLRLPCKVGDTVYRITSANTKIVEDEVLWFEKYGSNSPIVMLKEYEDVSAVRFGKTVFLTKEEAEQALKGGAV